MPRYPKGEKKEKKEVEKLPHSDLPKLTPAEHDFVNLFSFDTRIGGNATACYRKAFPNSKATPDAMKVQACRLKAKVDPWLTMITQSKGEQHIRTKEYRIAEMEAFADRCEAAGQFGAAFQARQAVGKLEGQYIELSENVNRTRDQMANLKSIASSMGREEALRFADQCGMRDELLKEMAMEGNA